MKNDDKKQILSLSDQQTVYLQLAQIIKKNRYLYKRDANRKIVDSIMRVFDQLDLSGLDGHGIYWPNLPLRFLNLQDMNLFKHNFYLESDVEILDPFNKEALFFRQKESPYIVKMVKRGGNIMTPLELATFLQFNLISHLSDDCFAVDGGLYFSLNPYNCRSDKCIWRIHKEKPTRKIKKIQVTRSAL